MKKHTSQIYSPKLRGPSRKDQKRQQRRAYKAEFAGKHGGYYSGPRRI